VRARIGTFAVGVCNVLLMRRAVEATARPPHRAARQRLSLAKLKPGIQTAAISASIVIRPRMTIQSPPRTSRSRCTRTPRRHTDEILVVHAMS
jgi:hypothetical protein